MGDGEQQEGSVWEAAMSRRTHRKLDSLCAVIDKNGLQIDGTWTASCAWIRWWKSMPPSGGTS